MPANYFLTEQDVSVLRELLHWWRNFSVEESLNPQSQPQTARPDTFISKPTSDIPAISGSIPGKGTADIYRIRVVSPVPVLELQGINVDVYNIWPTAIISAETDFLIVYREKATGRWIFDDPSCCKHGSGPGSGSGSGSGSGCALPKLCCQDPCTWPSYDPAKQYQLVGRDGQQWRWFDVQT